MRIFIYLLILLGMIVMAYPQLNETYQAHREQALLKNFESNMSILPSEQTPQLSQDQYNNISNTLAAGNENTVPTPTVKPLDNTSSSMLKNGAMAILSIQKIDALLPILEGASTENMKYAVTHISETTPLGKVGNAGIAGHRMRASGSLFNRLNEVSVGDKITIRKLNEEFTYTVFSVSIVDPNDVSVLSRNNTEKILTLITCDPIVNATHRLIVKAKIDK